MKGKEIRNLFLKYFESKDHKIVRSSSLIPENDPTLLFTNAGMVQFKNVFLGKEKKDFSRATSSQKCMRAGGKHNDLENVGKTARHHTFFEMLGNFSFGDYFKKEAIAFAWEFLIKYLNLPKEDIWITIYKDDDEAFELWQKVAAVKKERIVKLSEKDNFWSMGDVGPCGPCSEIIIDQGPNVGCKRKECSIECDCDRFLELWNLVFMQYNKKEDGKIELLPKPNIDTGMGLERITAVVQGVDSNFKTDLFIPIIRKIEEISGKSFEENITSFRVIADHARAATFLISDGVIPSNEGRGYVLRRIIRRAYRYGRYLDLDKPFLYKLVSVVVDTMCDTYFELVENANYISSLIKAEEERFSSTLNTGLYLIEELMENLKKKSQNIIPGKEIFKLYDTYGFPIDFTREIAEERGFLLDLEGFEKEMQLQRERAKRAWVGFSKEVSDIYKSIEKKTEFVGYTNLNITSEILAIIKKDQKVPNATSGDEVEIILDKTPFYPERGGQVGDKGIIKKDDAEALVLDTYSPFEDIILHKVKVIKGDFFEKDKVIAEVNKSIREAIAKNHTATHLLHAALRKILGSHVRQSGSLVCDKYLRFDFTHFSPLKEDEIVSIEKLVNEKIMQDLEVKVEVMSFEEALKSKAIALFEEKYKDMVRVISIDDFSKELCGGTHVKRTGEIGFFKILKEESIAAGVRRIEAVTGFSALDYIQRLDRTFDEIREILKSSRDEVISKISKLVEKVKELEKENIKLKKELSLAKIDEILSCSTKINGINFLAKEIENVTIEELRDISDKLKGKLKSAVIILGTKQKDKALLICSVSKDLIDKKIHAGEIISEVAKIIGGGGGGKPHLAQAGGRNKEKLAEAISRSKEIFKDYLSRKYGKA